MTVMRAEQRDEDLFLIELYGERRVILRALAETHNRPDWRSPDAIERRSRLWRPLDDVNRRIYRRKAEIRREVDD
jgi:hypothetical protein